MDGEYDLMHQEHVQGTQDVLWESGERNDSFKNWKKSLKEVLQYCGGCTGGKSLDLGLDRGVR